MTKQAKSPPLRYDEGCLAAHALNIIGDRWALLVVRELMFAPKRFQMIRAGLPGVTASVLAGRLAQLGQAGVLTHDARLGVYALTDAGRALLPVLEALCRWALTIPGHEPSRFISPSALMISMGVMLRRDRAAGRDACAGFDFGSEVFEMRLTAGVPETRLVSQPDAPFVLCGNGNTLAAAIYGKTPLHQMVARDVIALRGAVDAAQAFVDLFQLSARAVD